MQQAILDSNTATGGTNTIDFAIPGAGTHTIILTSPPPAIAGSVLIVLPMFGDYYTNDLISGSPHTNMLGNSVNLLVQGGSQKNLGAALVLVLMTILAIGMLYYLWETKRQQEKLAA